jgi:alkanesulfonate monooxygenase SsuD/methylene tetrahydromethanopterin reductase-like flavin-dependent oxidoreductase (luciferase family)
VSAKDVFVALLRGVNLGACVRGREIYLHVPDGFGRSKLTIDYFERRLGVEGTARNWRTLLKLLELCVLADLLARTRRIRVFPDVANLPLRGPAMIAKQAASLDVLSGGRFELGLGAGALWEAIAAMGGPDRSPREALEALEEAIRIIRLFWSGEPTITFEGRYYSVKGLHPGPPPVHPIGIWVGGYKPRMLNMIGRLADGWIPSLPYAPPDVIPDMQRRIDEGAAEAGRDPAEIRRVYNVTGDASAAELHGFVDELGFDALIYWPGDEDVLERVERFAADMMPALRR